MLYARSGRGGNLEPSLYYREDLGLAAALAFEPVFDFLRNHVAANVRDRIRQRNLFRADLDAILCKAAFLNAAVAGKRPQPLFFVDFARGMVVEQLDLRDGRRANKAGHVIELRANLHAAAAGNAIR